MANFIKKQAFKLTYRFPNVYFVCQIIPLSPLGHTIDEPMRLICISFFLFEAFNEDVCQGVAEPTGKMPIHWMKPGKPSLIRSTASRYFNNNILSILRSRYSKHGASS